VQLQQLQQGSAVDVAAVLGAVVHMLCLMLKISYLVAHLMWFPCRYLEDFSSRLGDAKATSTRGAISVHINSNEHTDSTHAQNWIDFDAQW
jgi:hypothetical protein